MKGWVRSDAFYHGDEPPAQSDVQWIQVVPALKINSELIGLHNGTAPDREEKYQDAWRDGIAAARDHLLEP